ncbi:hypothetical protein JHK86_004595 [Glycine max]|nr:hypothetical protein JHK86_004595 [Glycine max]
MAPFGRFTAEILMAVMFVGLFCVTNIVAQDSEIAPTGQLEAGTGFALPVSKSLITMILLDSCKSNSCSATIMHESASREETKALSLVKLEISLAELSIVVVHYTSGVIPT